MRWVERIREIGAGPVEEAAPLGPLTTLRVGGRAEALLRLADAEGLARVLEVCRRRGVKVHFLGNGSNVLVRDGGVAGLVVLMTGLRQLESEREGVTAGAGVGLITLVQAGLRAGLVGMEWASGIPGTVGGAVVMNAGAHGGATQDRVEAAYLVRPGRDPAWVPSSELHYAYRSSDLQEGGTAVLAARIRLERGDTDEGRRRLRTYLAHRKRTQPTGNNAGSMFKNPPGTYAGRLIEEAGAKGMILGGAQVSELHGNFFLNTGAARAQDILDLIDQVRGRVQAQTGIELHLEVRVWGRP